MERYKDEVNTKTSIVPYVFMSTLTLIVDRSDERIDFYLWNYDASNRQLKKIILKSYNVHTTEKESEHTLWSMDAEETQKRDAELQDEMQQAAKKLPFRPRG